jgi:hypothetical protein
MNTTRSRSTALAAQLLTFAIVLLSPLATASSASSTGAAVLATERRAVELTFLKSQPGQREQLKSFIVQNWFAMDKIAKDQGLMHAYTLLDTGSDEGPWNVVVSVTYMNDKGYDGIVEAFEKIRRAHTTVRVEGKTLRDLGSIIETKRTFENPAHNTR